MQPLSRELISWTHEALKHVYDLPFLERHCRAAILNGQFVDGHVLQDALSGVVKRLRPPVQIPAHSPAWRIYNVLNLRYMQGLSQSEVADRLNIGSRQLRREQLKVTEAVAAMLFEQVGWPEQPTPLTRAERAERDLDLDTMPTDVRQVDVIRMDELLLAALHVLDPLLQRQDLHIAVTATGEPPAAKASRMITRQMLISALNWWINGLSHCTSVILMDTTGGRILIRFLPCSGVLDSAMVDEPESGHSCESQAEPGADAEPLLTLRRLAQLLPAGLRIQNVHSGSRCLEITLPACEMACVVLIDDNPDAVQLVRRYLHQSSEYYLVAITRAEEAFKQVLALQPSCILLDVMMPGRDGWELLTLFKTHPETASIPIIVSSVLKEGELAVALGASAMLPKPFNAHQLSTTLSSAIAHARQTRAASVVSAPRQPASTREQTDPPAG